MSLTITPSDPKVFFEYWESICLLLTDTDTYMDRSIPDRERFEWGLSEDIRPWINHWSAKETHTFFNTRLELKFGGLSFGPGLIRLGRVRYSFETGAFTVMGGFWESMEDELTDIFAQLGKKAYFVNG